ncbi:hypothetical protein CAC42_5423 [Sphaceloma murrayae]|uniref:Uncharacterized protein n=1 Tax=Sphaceloma murrayae TaxID=2082308 RepID=A0A2K1QUZ2_9PEZI|nr:hypothetical protein CAC42_5423 [Sphaceloma murrayae]
MATLTTNDSRVLSALFDPEASPSSAANIEHDSQTLPGLSPEECSRLTAEETLIIQQLHSTAPSPEHVERAHQAISKLIADHPNFAPAYIDRAQIQRLSLPMDHLFTSTKETESRNLLQDLQKGIELASPPSPQSPVSGLQTRLLAAAHTHRGLLLLKIADMRRQLQPIFGAGTALTDLDPSAIEGVASKDFYQGGRYGNRIAQQLSVKTNPYAKMCGAIVKEAIQRDVDEAEGRFVSDLSALA